MTLYAHWGLKGLFTALFALIGVLKLIQAPPLVESLSALGYPSYILLILGVAYLAGLFGIWQRSSSTLREWTYAGYTFALLGALSSHILGGDPVSKFMPSILLLAILAGAYVLEKRNSQGST